MQTMKKAKLLLTMAVIIVTTMICCSMSAFALTEGDWQFQLLDNEVTITGYLGSGGDVVIPETIYGCPVTKVLLDSGKTLEAATEISFPKTVTEIKNIASYSKTLKKVNLNEGLKIIRYRAFQNCNQIEYVNFPSTLEVIEEYAFGGCKSIANPIIIHQSVTEIENGAFEDSGITSLTFVNADPKMGEFVFARCKNLKKVDLGTRLSTISSYAFKGCEALEELIIPNTVTMIQTSSFSECVSLKEIILPTSLKMIGFQAFEGCSGIKQVVIPYGVVSVDSAFNNCANLEAVFVPDTVTDKYPVFFKGSDNALVYCSAESKAAEICKDRSISYLTDNSVNSGIHVYYNSKRISFHSYGQNPEILEGRTLVPLRSIFEAMGAEVEWDGATSTAIAKRGNVEVKITIGATEIYKNGKAVPVDVPAMLLNSRTMVPARVIAEAFGAAVEWNGNGRVVLITE